MANSQNPTPNCFSSILHRLLCSGSVPTYPSDHISNSETIKFNFPEKESQTEPKENKVQATTSTNPGIVGRLMGLDSWPTNTDWVPKQRTLESFLRSRSVNFVDYLPEFDRKQPDHRRVRSSVSFREDPAFYHQENHDCLVLCFEKQLGKSKDGLRTKSEMGFEEMKLKNAKRSKNKEGISEKALLRKKNDEKRNDKPNKSSGKISSKIGNFHGNPHGEFKSRSHEKPKNCKQVSIISSQTKKKKNQLSAKRVVPENEAENSSPNFEVQDCPVNPTASVSGLMRMSSKTKSAPKMANWDDPSPNLIRTDDDQELRRTKKRANKTSKTREAEYYVELSSLIRRLTEEDEKETNWVERDLSKFEGYQELCTEFGNQILELVMDQVVNELVGLHLMKNLV